MNDQLTVVTVSWRSTEMLRLLLKNLLHKTDTPEKLNFLVIDNTGGSDKNLRRLALEYDNLIIHPIDSGGRTGSVGHAYGLDAAMPMIKTPYAAIVDPDIHVFIDKWNELFIQELQETNIIAIGAPYPWWKLGKYHDFPSPPFIIFKTDILRSLGESWYPFSLGRIRNIYNFLGSSLVRFQWLATRQRLRKQPLLRSACQNMEKLIGVCSPDTGWRFARAAKASRLESIVFQAIDSNAPCLSHLLNDSIVCDLANHFELFEFQGMVALSHMYSSSSYHWSTSRGGDVQHWRRCTEHMERILTGRID